MADFKVVWSDRSLIDLKSAYNFLSENSTQAATKTVQSILDRVAQLESFPKSGPIEQSLKRQKKEHRYLVEGNHKIVYRLEKRRILIVRVFDARQHPRKLN